MLSQEIREWWKHLRRHWHGYLFLLILFCGVLAIASFQPSGSAWQQIAFNVAAGILSLLLFQVVTDYKNLRLMSEVLDRHQTSFHIGGRLYQSHRSPLIDREAAISKYLAKGDTFRLLTTTADDYVIEESRGYDPLRRKLRGPLKVQILLFTPVFHLRSYLDWSNEDTAGEIDGEKQIDREEQEDQKHGQKHLHASKLIQAQKDHIIPAILKLQQEFPDKIEVKFFHLKHHVNMAIYGKKRLFAAPLLSNTKGRELPCLEVFPGTVDSVLFGKMSAEFEYLWRNPKLVFTVDEMKKIYGRISQEVPQYFTNRWMEADTAISIEKFAHQLIKKRISAVIREESHSAGSPTLH